MFRIIKYVLFMIVTGAIVSFSLSIINEITLPIIENQKIELVKDSLLKVDNVNKWIDGSNYIDITKNEEIENVFVSLNNDNEYQNIAYVINTKGYKNGNIQSIIFINYNFKKILKVDILSIVDQTKGIGSLIKDDINYVKIYENISVSKYYNDNVNKHNSDSIDIISGATISSKAVVKAVILACNNFNESIGDK